MHAIHNEPTQVSLDAFSPVLLPSIESFLASMRVAVGASGKGQLARLQIVLKEFITRQVQLRQIRVVARLCGGTLGKDT